MITRDTNTAFIESQQYSDFILETLPAHLLPQDFYRNVTDFQTGTTLDIKTVGDATIQEITEDEDITFNPIESGNVQLSITDYIGDGWYVTDEMRQDSSQLEALHQARAMAATRAIAQRFETRFLSVLNAGQTASDRNLINGFSHRFKASGSNLTVHENDLIDMKVAFNKAYVPNEGRIAIVDSVTAAAFDKRATITSNLNVQTPLMEQLVTSGFMQNHQFVTNLHGWTIFTSEMLPAITGETLTEADGSSSGSTSGVANIFLSIAAPDVTPGMVAWRQPPRVETDREMPKRRDRFSETTRFGIGVQRVDSLGVIVSSATATA